MTDSTVKMCSLAATLATALCLSGCLSVFTETGYKNQVYAAKVEHYYDFYHDQTQQLAAMGECERAAWYLQRSWREELEGSFGEEGVEEELGERYRADALSLTQRCEREEVPARAMAGQFDEIEDLYEALAKLPVPEARQQELARRAKTVDLLKARALAERGEALWEQGDRARALVWSRTPTTKRRSSMSSAWSCDAPPKWSRSRTIRP